MQPSLTTGRWTTRQTLMLIVLLEHFGSRRWGIIASKMRVKNELQVVSNAKRKMVDAKDSYITSQIEKSLSKENIKVDVRSDAGVVQLTGKASLMNSAKASEVSRRVEGVKYVKNTIAIQP